MNTTVKKIIGNVERVFKGKSEAVLNLTAAILSGGHALIDDVPGVGKTTLAIAFAKTLGLEFKRIQFTPDVLPADIVGYTVLDLQGREQYRKGVLIGAGLVLADEINRATGKTQSAMLEAMAENQVTVDGVSHLLSKPFIVIATQNRVGSIGTQPLPFAELDRFCIRIKIGYPDVSFQSEILKSRAEINPLDELECVITLDELNEMKTKVGKIVVSDLLYDYVSRLTDESRKSEYLELGLSPRAALNLLSLAKANAYILGREYLIAQDVRDFFVKSAEHRVILSSLALSERLTAEKVLESILQKVEAPDKL